MLEAIRLSQNGVHNNEGGPFGCVIVKGDEIVGRGNNKVSSTNDPTAHAEILAITSACNYLGAKYLPDATLYVTIEPCLMCCGALYWSKIGRIVYGASDPKNGYQHITNDAWPFHPKTELVKGVLEQDCAQLMKDFFKSKR